MAQHIHDHSYRQIGTIRIYLFRLSSVTGHITAMLVILGSTHLLPIAPARVYPPVTSHVSLYFVVIPLFYDSRHSPSGTYPFAITCYDYHFSLYTPPL
jgi:hypothetical protein